MVQSSHISDAHVTEVTKETFDKLLHDSKTYQDMHGAETMSIGAAVALILSLWPFVVVCLQKEKITADQLKQASVHILGTYGERLALKFLAVAVFGPIALWTLLAKTIIQVTDAGGIN